MISSPLQMVDNGIARRNGKAMPVPGWVGILALAAIVSFCNIRTVAQAEPAADGIETATFDAAWKEVRADGDIQFIGKPPKPEPELPEWWTDFLEWFADVLAPVGEAISASWPVLRVVLVLLLAAGILTLLWVILKPYIDEWRGRRPDAATEEWAPDHQTARQLLREAEALAADGQFEEATHLLLYRSIEDIEKRRPELLRPSNTSREIERFEGLPEKARNMFAIIASHVERGIFAAIPVGEDGWTASRNAYREFALKENWRAVVRK